MFWWINPCYYRLSQSRMLPWSPKGFKSINRDPYSHSSGCPRRLKSRNFKSLPWDQWGFAQPQNLFKNSSKFLYIFPVFWLLLIPDGVEFSTKRLQAQFFVRPFTENMTLLIKMHSIFSTEKKVKQKPVPYKHQDVTVYRRRFAAFNGKKWWHRSCCLIWEKTYSISAP